MSACCLGASTADHLAYNLKLLDALAYGKVEVTSSWRDSLKSKGHLVTDARSLSYVNGSGLATEIQVSLDILTVRQLVQEGIMALHWVPTWRQFADGLTKIMPDELFAASRRTGCLNVVQTPEDEVEEGVDPVFVVPKESGVKFACRKELRSDANTPFWGCDVSAWHHSTCSILYNPLLLLPASQASMF